MGSKKKKPPMGSEAADGLEEILAGMAQLLEWMEQLLSAARKYATAPSSPADGPPPGAGPKKRRAVGHIKRRKE